MEQEIQTIVINYESDIKQSDANRLNALADALEKLDKVNIDDSNAQKLKNIGDALSGFKSFRVGKGFGDGIDEVVKTINKLETVKDITPFADNLVNGFNAVSKATEGFQTKMGANINKNLGDGVIGLVNAINGISEVKDITHQANNLKKGFNVINEATETFKGGSLAKLNSNLGVGVTNLVNAINSISEVKDITQHADSLNKGFDTIGRATESFQTRIGAKISGTLGDGITGLINAINKITEVKDITPYASNMQYSFSVISTAISHFSGMELNKLGKIGENVDSLVNTINRITEIKDISIYAHLLSQNFEVLANALSHFDGMDLSKLRNVDSIVNAFNNLGTIKPIDETIIKNAEMLAKAINTLDKSVGTSDTRLKALGSATRAVGRDFNNGSKSVEKFNKSLSVMQIAGTIWAIQKVARTMKSLISTVYGFVDAFGDVQNTLSFFNQSLEGEAPRIANIIQQYSDAGVIDFAEFSNQVSKLNQMYKSYGIAAEDAATMALSMTQVAYDASYALGENGKDIELWLNRVTSMSTGQVRSGYYLGLDLSVKSLSESFEGLTNNADKATKVTAMYDEVMRQTVAIQGQMVREIENTYVRANILSNRFRHLKQSIGQALIPAFESLIEIAMISIKVIELLFNAIASLWGGEFKLLDYGAMINDMASSSGGMSSIADSAEDLSSGIGNANKQAKELKKTISGIDQVFTINDMKAPDAAGGGGAAGGIGGIGGGIGGYDWLDALAKSANVEYLQSIEEKAQGIANAIQRWFPWVLTAAAAFQAMKFSKKFIDNLKWIDSTKDIFGGLGLSKFTAGLGIGLLIDDVLKFKDALDKLLAGDTSLMNLSKMVGSFAGIMGDLMLITGNWKGAAVFIAIEGLTKVVGAISDMTKNGINPQNLSLALDGVGAVLISFGLYQAIVDKNPKMLGIGLILTGVSNIVGQFDNVLTAIRTGDWSGVDKIQLFTGVVMAIGGIAVALGKFNSLIKGSKITSDVKKVVSSTTAISGVTAIEKEHNKLKMPSWKSIGQSFVIIAGGLALIISTIWLIGQIDTSTLEKSKRNTVLIGGAFMDLVAPLTLTLASAIAIGMVINKKIINWGDIASGLLAIDAGIVNMILMVSLASLWDTDGIERGKNNMSLVGDAFRAIESPLNLLLIKAGVIGAIITSSMGLAALSLAAGILAINATVLDMMMLTNLASKWETKNLTKGKVNIEIAATAFETINSPLNDLLDMIGKIGKNMSLASWLTGRSYDFDKALSQLKSTMDSLLHWIGEYAAWDTPRLKDGSKAIDLAGKAGSTINQTLSPLLDMIESIGKNTNNIFGLGDYDYDASLELLQGIMESLLHWIGEYSTWDTESLISGGKTIDLAGKAGNTINKTLAPLLEMLNGIGGHTNNIFGIGDYNYDKAFGVLQKVMNNLISWIEKYSSWETNDLEKGGEVIDLAGKAGSTINQSLSPLLDMLDKIGGNTNKIFGLGNYNYDKALLTLQKIMDSMIKWIGKSYVSWDVDGLEKGSAVLAIASEPLSIINDSFADLLPLLDGIGKETNNFLGIGDYNYDKALGIIVNSIETIVKSVSKLGVDVPIENVNSGVAVIRKAKEVMNEMENFSTTGGNDLPTISTNFKNFALSIEEAFKTLGRVRTDNVDKIMKALSSIDLNKFRGLGTDMVKAMELGINNYNFNFTQMTNKIKKSLTIDTTDIGTKMAQQLVSGINNSNANASAFINKVKSSLTVNMTNVGTKMAQEVVSGINRSSANASTFTNRVKTTLTVNMTSVGTTMARQVTDGINNSSANASTFTNKVKSSMTVNMTSIGSQMGRQVVSGINGSSVSLGSFTNKVRSGLNTNTYYIGSDIARGVVNGINGYYPNVTPFTNSLKNGMKRAFNIHSPSRWARDVIGAMIGEGAEDGINETKVDVGLFKSNIAKELDGFDVKPSVEMPTLDTRSFYQTLDKNAMNMNTSVQSKYDIDSDKTSRSVNEMKDTMVGLLQDLIDAVDEKETGIQASDIVKIAERGIKDNIVRNNKV